jgi:hypothetical protein
MVLFFGIFSCTKDEMQVKPKIKDESNFLKPGEDLHQLLMKNANPKGQNILESLYLLGESFREIKKNKQLNKIILDQAKKSSNKQVRLSFLMAADPRFKNIIETTLLKESSNGRIAAGKQIKTVNDILENLSYDTTQYEAEIYIPNLDVANPNLSPIIAIAEEVDNQTLTIAGLKGDVIAGWDENDKEILIDEETGMNALNPIYIINNGVGAQGDTQQSATGDGNQKSARVDQTNFVIASIPIIMYRINAHYEGDSGNKNEYSYVYRRYGTDGYIGSQPDRTHIADISKSDVSNTTFFPSDRYISVADDGIQGAFVATFEYDWYASKKTVYVSEETPIQVSLEARMKYSHEYYQRFYMPKNARTDWTEKGVIAVNWVY